jgi:sirohydrochlorin ferrochelatase
MSDTNDEVGEATAPALDEKAWLEAYEGFLEASRRRLAEVKREHDSITSVVNALRRRVYGAPEITAGTNITYRGKQTYITMIEDLMADGEPRSLKQVAEAMRGRGVGGSDISKETVRQSLMRLVDLGNLEKIERGVYQKRQA